MPTTHTPGPLTNHGQVIATRGGSTVAALLAALERIARMTCLDGVPSTEAEIARAAIKAATQE